MVTRDLAKVETAGSSPVYRFCSTKKGHPERMSFFVERAPSGAQSSSVFVPLRSAQSRCPPDTLRRLSLMFNKKRTSGKDVLFRRKSPIRGSKFERLRSTAVGAEQVSTGHLAPSIASVQQKRTSGKDVPFSLKELHPGLKVRASSFHYGRRRAGVHRTPCAVYRFCSTKKER